MSAKWQSRRRFPRYPRVPRKVSAMFSPPRSKAAHPSAPACNRGLSCTSAVRLVHHSGAEHAAAAAAAEWSGRGRLPPAAAAES